MKEASELVLKANIDMQRGGLEVTYCTGSQLCAAPPPVCGFLVLLRV